MTVTFQTNKLRPREIVMPEHGPCAEVQKGFYARFGKRFLDVSIVLASLPIVLPLLLLSAVGNVVTGAPVFYSQQRVGRYGKPFRIWKLSTMHRDADRMLEQMLRDDPDRRQEWMTTQKLKEDPRITRFGAILRRTSIDEIPQLFNVLKGDMSLLGPRPMMLDQVEIYGPTLAIYLSLRPGISGKWQVSERNNAHFRRRAQIDAEYARELSFKSDMLLVAKTLRTLLRSTGY